MVFRAVKNIQRKARWSLLFVVGFSLLGYQPVIGFPPLQRVAVHAQEQPHLFQEAKIDAGGFSHPFVLPHPGYISTLFSSWHPGIDIAMGLGTPVHPISSGKVVEVSYGFFGLGNTVIIEHEQGIKSTYGHLGRIFTKAGDSVTSNSTIGEVGMTGRTSGPHTHLEVTKDGRYINPQTILPKLDPMPFVASASSKPATAAGAIAAR